MAQEAVVIPEKIYFKIGEVCDLVGVQTHVLRYWETEFTALSPQKNKSGQRSYRRRDVEIALRIKQLLYNELFTIAGANKKLQQEARDGSKTKASTTVSAPSGSKPTAASSYTEAPMLFDAGFDRDGPEPLVISTPTVRVEYNGEQKDVLKVVAGHLIEMREMLRNSQVS